MIASACAAIHKKVPPVIKLRLSWQFFVNYYLRFLWHISFLQDISTALTRYELILYGILCFCNTLCNYTTGILRVLTQYLFSPDKRTVVCSDGKQNVPLVPDISRPAQAIFSKFILFFMTISITIIVIGPNFALFLMLIGNDGLMLSFMALGILLIR